MQIQPAWILGKLIDLGPYPALLAGGDRVLGELWSFHSNDIASVFEQLDRVEQTNQPGLPNEYDRVRVTATVHSGGAVEASTYRYADTTQAAQYIPLSASLLMDGHLYVSWPR